MHPKLNKAVTIKLSSEDIEKINFILRDLNESRSDDIKKVTLSSWVRNQIYHILEE